MARNATRAITLVYRGQLEIERSRIEFIVAGLCREFDVVDVVHLSPGIGSDEARLREFASVFPQVRRVSFISAQSSRALLSRRRLRKVLAQDALDIVAVGFSVWPYVAGLGCRAWFINGIPEERLLGKDSLMARAVVRGVWWGARTVRSELIVVVSQPMSRIVQSRHLRTTRVEVIPNAVDLATYTTSPSSVPTYITYQGGGSPWQGLQRLADVWSAMYTLDSSLKFRIISRDRRTAILASGLPSNAIELVSSADADGVAHLLSEARLGFLYRAPTLVNAVSWPMKLGEYLAAGAAVVVTDCGWDIAPLVERFDAGLVVRWEDSPHQTARAVVDYLTRIGDERPEGVAAAAGELATDSWEPVVRHALRSTIQSTPGRARA